MSLFTRRMELLTAVVLESDSEKVIKALIAMGAIEFVKVTDIPDRLTERPVADTEDYRALRIRIETILSEGGIPKPSFKNIPEGRIGSLDADEIEKKIDSIYAEIEWAREEQKKISKKIDYRSDVLSYSSSGGKYLDIRVGRTEKTNSDEFKSRLEEIGGVFILDRDPMVLLMLKRDSKKTNELLEKFGWTESVSPDEQRKGRADAIEKCGAELSGLNEELGRVKSGEKEKISERSEELISMWVDVRMHELAKNVGSLFAYTEHTVMFSGWMPLDVAEDVTSTITRITGGKCLMEYGKEEDSSFSAPVALESPGILKPFERIVSNYATPEYGSINPTPFTAVAYMAMFLLMFADVGQGLILFLIGLFFSLNYKKHPLKKDGIISRYLSSLLMYLGPCSIIGGILFGSCFGFSIPALWFPYDRVVEGQVTTGLVTTIYDILGITIKFGIGVIYLGLILNWINLFKKKRYVHLVFDKNGLVGGALYALGIWFAFGFVRSGYREFPSSPVFTALLSFFLLLLFLKVPVESAEKKKKGQAVEHVLMNTVMEFLVQALEIFSGFLSNTLSFMRVAGLGIAHASLMSAFFSMAGLTGNKVFFILIIVLGNLLVVALEGLSAGIQALRLSYYEFFTKYFTDYGTPYRPVGLESDLGGSV